MSDQPRVGGLDQRYAPRRAGRVHMANILLAVVLGAAAGVALAASTVPHPGCQPEDGMCKLQRIYLAQLVKVAGGMLLFFLVAETFVIRIPNRIDRRRRERDYELELASRPPVAPPRPFDASVARAALDAVGRGAALPPAALRALARAEEEGAPTAPAARRLGSPTARQARETLAALNASAALPPAALRALQAATPTAPAPAPAAPAAAAEPAPAPPSPDAAARAALDAVNRAPKLPPAALEALLRQGPALGGGPRGPAPAPDPPAEP